MKILIKKGKAVDFPYIFTSLIPNIKDLSEIKLFNIEITEDMKPQINGIGMGTYQLTYDNDIQITISESSITIQNKKQWLNITDIFFLDMILFLEELYHMENLIKEIILNKPEFSKLVFGITDIIKNNYESYYDVKSIEINNNIKNIIDEPMLKKLNPSIEEIEEFKGKLLSYEKYKVYLKSVTHKAKSNGYEKSKIISLLNELIYIQLKDVYHLEIENNGNRLREYIQDRISDKLNKEKLYATYKNYKFEDAKHNLDDLDYKLQEIEYYLL